MGTVMRVVPEETTLAVQVLLSYYTGKQQTTNKNNNNYKYNYNYSYNNNYNYKLLRLQQQLPRTHFKTHFCQSSTKRIECGDCRCVEESCNNSVDG